MGRGNSGAWASGTVCSRGTVDDTWTISTSFWMDCEEWEEGIMAVPGCTNWFGVTKGGAKPLFEKGPDEPETCCSDSTILLNVNVGSADLGWTAPAAGKTLSSNIVVGGVTNCRLVVLISAERRPCIGPLLGFKTVVESAGNAEECEESNGECTFGAVGLKDGSKGDGVSKNGGIGTVEDPLGIDALMAGYGIVWCTEGGVSNLDGGWSKDCCWVWSPSEAPWIPCKYVGAGIMLFVVGRGYDEPHDPKLPPGWYKGTLLCGDDLGSPRWDVLELKSFSDLAPVWGKLVDVAASCGIWDCISTQISVREVQYDQ